MTGPKGDPDPDDVALGLRIKLLRRSAGISQASLGQAIGISFQQVGQYERGTNRITWSRLKKMAAALNISVVDLIAPLEGPPPPAGPTSDYLRLLLTPGVEELLTALSTMEETARIKTIRAVLSLT